MGYWSNYKLLDRKQRFDDKFVIAFRVGTVIALLLSAVAAGGAIDCGPDKRCWPARVGLAGTVIGVAFTIIGFLL
jgi:hypothetical protein